MSYKAFILAALLVVGLCASSSSSLRGSESNTAPASQSGTESQQQTQQSQSQSQGSVPSNENSSTGSKSAVQGGNPSASQSASQPASQPAPSHSASQSKPASNEASSNGNANKSNNGEMKTTFTFTYNSQNRQGTFTDNQNGQSISAYSGDQSHYNEAQYQQLSAQGPLPNGYYKVASCGSHIGPHSCALEPINGTNTYGRSGFYIHGDNAQMDHTASEGCIIVGPSMRQNVEAGDTVYVHGQ